MTKTRPKTHEERIAESVERTARLRGVHARMVADRHRESVAGERRLRLSLVPPPAKGRKAPKKKARTPTNEELIADIKERQARLLRLVADRHREEAAPERRSRLKLVVTPPEDEAA